VHLSTCISVIQNPTFVSQALKIELGGSDADPHLFFPH